MEITSLSIKPGDVFCKDCANLIGVRTSIHNAGQWICGAKENEKGIDLVTGEKTYKQTSCIFQRITIGLSFCSPEGKWFKLYEQPKNRFISEAPKKLSSISLDDI